jgi:hypothetical protein
MRLYSPAYKMPYDVENSLTDITWSVTLLSKSKRWVQIPTSSEKRPYFRSAKKKKRNANQSVSRQSLGGQLSMVIGYARKQGVRCRTRRPAGRARRARRAPEWRVTRLLRSAGVGIVVKIQ